MALFDHFARLIRGEASRTPAAVAQRSAQLTQWMTQAARSELPELASFVTKLRQDLAAVRAGLTLPYSQGQVEGQVTKITLLKRQMFGRASFDLLRKCFLLTATG